MTYTIGVVIVSTDATKITWSFIEILIQILIILLAFPHTELGAPGDELENFRQFFSRCANRDAAPLNLKN